jgi:hypothetical protein
VETAAPAEAAAAQSEPPHEPELRVSAADRIEPPQGAPPAEEEEDAPGALMDVLSRADAEAAAHDDPKRKS